MKQGESYIKDKGDFLAKLKAAAEVPKGAISPQDSRCCRALPQYPK